MECMVDKRMSVSMSRNREPRFERSDNRIYQKNKRRNQIKKDLFATTEN